jgi:predicted AlkP superfamily pyrophosphatase or phosphodiesterase
MKNLLALLIILSVVQFANAQNQKKVNAPAQQQQPYVILVSADGFRYDYAEKYQAQNILALAKSGVSTASMLPTFPASTQANHIALVTGLHGAHSGITGNSFYDPARKAFYKGNDGSWFEEDPIWVTAEKAGMLTASFNFVASAATIHGVKPTYYQKYNNENKSADARVAVIKKWLDLPAETRPHFIAFYNSDTDHAGHEYGPNANEVKASVLFIDTLMAKLNLMVKATGLPVNVVLVSDHGMTAITKDQILETPKVDTTKFVMVNQFQHINLYARNKEDVLATYESLKQQAKGYQVFLKKDIPADLHYGEKDDRYNRVGDILITANWPMTFYSGKITGTRGVHGYNPHQVKDMHAIFYAWGPAFKSNLKLKSFDNIEVYGAVMKVLGLSANENDGTGFLIKEALK